MPPARLLAIEYGSRFEQRGPAALDGLDDAEPALDVQECRLLTGEGRLRQVFGGRRAAHGHRPLAELSIGGGDLLLDRGGHFRLLNGVLHRHGFGIELVVIVDVETFEDPSDHVIETGVLDELSIRARGDHESRRDGDVRLRQLAQIGALSAHERHIVSSDFREPDDVLGVSVHGESPSEWMRRSQLAEAGYHRVNDFRLSRSFSIESTSRSRVDVGYSTVTVLARLRG